MAAMNLPSTDQANAEFWNELCGSSFAKRLGIVDHSMASLQRFDRAYFDLYPYLLDRVPARLMRDMRVLEVGLGYGTLGQVIAEHAKQYIGLDIADGPVKMMNERLQMHGLEGRAMRGSMLNCPLADASVDAVVSIGCFHHTGDVARCFDETWRVLRPGGRAYVMVYNRFSYRQWLKWPRAALRAWFEAAPENARADEAQRRAYDADSAGRAAPETVFLSMRDLRQMLSRFSAFAMRKENCDHITLRGRAIVPRRLLLSSLGRLAGLDIYLQLVK